MSSHDAGGMRSRQFRELPWLLAPQSAEGEARAASSSALIAREKTKT